MIDEYVRRRWQMFVVPFVDPERPAEVLQRLSVSAVRQAGQFYTIRPGTIASLIKKIMADVGIDVTKFKAHVIRSAAIAAATTGGEQVDSVLQQATVSRKVFSIFYDLLVSAGSAIAVDSSSVVAPLAASVHLAGAAQSGDSAPPSNHGDTSGVFSRQSLMDVADGG